MNGYIRYATINDADVLGEIHSKSLTASHKGIIPDEFLYKNFSFEKRRKGLYKELRTGSPDTAIIYKDNQAVGMITIGESRYTKKENSLIEVWRIYVLPSYWRNGLGTELLNWGINEIRYKGFKKAELWVLEKNYRARSFYERFGFKHDGTIQVNNLGVDLKEYRYIIAV